MGTGALTGRTAQLIQTEIAFCGLDDRRLGYRVPEQGAAAVADFNHPDIVVGAGVGTGRAANAGIVIDHHLTVGRRPVNGARRATDHADGIHAMHTGVGHHVMVVAAPMTVEARIVVMGLGAGHHAFVTAGATVHVHQHGRRAVDVTMFHQEFQHARFDGLGFRRPACPGFLDTLRMLVELTVLSQFLRR